MQSEIGWNMNDIQTGLLEMMCDIDAALREAGVDYTLTYGTGIGAVRHKGFIPWDDDIDIIIRYDQIEEFEKSMDLLPKGKYFLQKPLSIDWANTFYKIKMNGTTAIEESHLSTRMHQGLFVDVFVARRCPKPGFRRLCYWAMEMIQRGQRMMCFSTYGRSKLDFFQKLIQWTCRINLKIRDLLSGKNPYLYMDEPTGCRQVFDRSMFEDMIDVEFEGHMFRMIRRYDEFLTVAFGDYMTLPPEEERVGSHLIAYDHDEDYKVWLERHYASNPKDNPYRKSKKR